MISRLLKYITYAGLISLTEPKQAILAGAGGGGMRALPALGADGVSCVALQGSPAFVLGRAVFTACLRSSAKGGGDFPHRCLCRSRSLSQ